MKPYFYRLIFLAVLVAVPAEATSLKETWYLYRGRENMKIENYKAAIEAYESAVRINPESQEASKNLGIAYEKQGIVDKAVSQYDNYLGKFENDHEIALRQARLLKWSRYSYRHKDAIKYYRQSIKHKNDPKVRLEYAELLATQKETSPEAINEFNAVLAKEPDNPQAHRGLAKAYAWIGDQDRALYHSKRAREFGDQGSDVKNIERDISKNRRPEVGGELFFLHQVSGRLFDLSGVRAGALGHKDISPFISVNARLGTENFWSPSVSSSGAYVGVEAEYRVAPLRSLEADILFQSMAHDGLSAKFQYVSQGEEGRLTVGIKRELRYDSYVSLIGSDQSGVSIGAARNQILFLQLESTMFGMPYKLTPYLGWVTAQAVSPNTLFGTDFDLTYMISDETTTQWSVLSSTRLATYARDHSGFNVQPNEPLAGGYFSPSSFFSQGFKLKYERFFEKEGGWSAAAGPSIQSAQDTNSDGGLQVGWSATGSYLKQASERLYIKIEADAERTAAIYTRFQLMGWLTYRF